METVKESKDGFWLDEAVEELLGRTKVARRVPRDVREEIHAILRQPARQRKTLAEVWQDLRLKERFRVGEYSFRKYARLFAAVDGDGVRRQVAVAISELLLVPAQHKEYLYEAGKVLLLARLGKMLREEYLEPNQLAKLAEAMAKGQEAAARLAERRRADRQDARAQRQTKKPPEKVLSPDEKDAMFHDRIRQIYGIKLPRASTMRNGVVVPGAGEASTVP